MSATSRWTRRVVANFVVLGSVVVDKVEKDRLSCCPNANFIGIRLGKPFFLCGFGCGVCGYNGKWAKFEFHFSGFKCVWVCPKLDVLPDLER